jgi:2-dehydropantoate 2-reductase
MGVAFEGNNGKKTKMSHSILIVGTGALATFFANRLSVAGVDVTMLGTWLEGLTALRTGGAHLVGEGSFAVRTTDNPSNCRGAKLALVLVKSWQTERAAQQLADCLAEDGLAVTIQNGLGNDDILSKFLGLRRVSRGVTNLGVTLLAPGFVRLNGSGWVTLETHPQLFKLETILRVANIEGRVVEDLLPDIWSKLMINSAINPLTALLRVKNGKLLSIPTARELMRNLARETASVAEALGVALPFSVPEHAVEEVAWRTADNISSMLQDVLRDAPTEVEAINGAVVRKGVEKQVITPVNQVVWSLVKALHPE